LREATPVVSLMKRKGQKCFVASDENEALDVNREGVAMRNQKSATLLALSPCMEAPRWKFQLLQQYLN
jgi:hypothetical protein